MARSTDVLMGWVMQAKQYTALLDRLRQREELVYGNTDKLELDVNDVRPQPAFAASVETMLKPCQLVAMAPLSPCSQLHIAHTRNGWSVWQRSSQGWCLGLRLELAGMCKSAAPTLAGMRAGGLPCSRGVAWAQCQGVTLCSHGHRQGPESANRHADPHQVAHVWHCGMK